MNNGDGTFTKVTQGPAVTNGGSSFGSSFGDIDNDGDLDFIVTNAFTCLLYTSDAADERSSVDLGGRRIIKKKKKKQHILHLYRLDNHIYNTRNTTSLSLCTYSIVDCIRGTCDDMVDHSTVC